MARRTIALNRSAIHNHIRALYVQQLENGHPKYTLAQIAAFYDVSTTHVYDVCKNASARLSRHEVVEAFHRKVGVVGGIGRYFTYVNNGVQYKVWSDDGSVAAGVKAYKAGKGVLA